MQTNSTRRMIITYHRKTSCHEASLAFLQVPSKLGSACIPRQKTQQINNLSTSTEPDSAVASVVTHVRISFASLNFLNTPRIRLFLRRILLLDKIGGGRGGEHRPTKRKLQKQSHRIIQLCRRSHGQPCHAGMIYHYGIVVLAVGSFAAFAFWRVTCAQQGILP